MKITWIFLFFLNHMSFKSHLVSQSKNKLISNNYQSFIATELMPITFGVI